MARKTATDYSDSNEFGRELPDHQLCWWYFLLHLFRSAWPAQDSARLPSPRAVTSIVHKDGSLRLVRSHDEMELSSDCGIRGVWRSALWRKIQRAGNRPD